MFLPHFDVFGDLLLNRPMHIPVSYRLTVRGFASVLGIFLSPKRYFSSLALLLFFFVLFVNSFFEKFFNVFTCSKQNNGENIL